MTKYVLLAAFVFIFVRKTGVANDWSQAAIVSIAFTLVCCVIAEIVLFYYRKARKVEERANRRDAMFFIEEWIDPKTGEAFRLDERFDGLYECLPREELEDRAEDFYRLHADAGNQSCLPDLPDELRLPVRVIYARAGGNRMEKSHEYLIRCEAEIVEVNNNYHRALADVNGGTNYRQDVLRNPHHRSYVG